MTYKDPDKQREANAERQRRYKAKQKALLEQGVTKGVTPGEVDLLLSKVLCKPDVGEDFTTEGVTVIDERSNEPSNVIPGPDSNKRRIFEESKPKRGKAIKCFADLPPDVQETISMMSRRDGKIDPIDKARRTKIAIHYRTTCFGAQGM